MTRYEAPHPRRRRRGGRSPPSGSWSSRPSARRSPSSTRRSPRRRPPPQQAEQPPATTRRRRTATARTTRRSCDSARPCRPTTTSARCSSSSTRGADAEGRLPLDRAVERRRRRPTAAWRRPPPARWRPPRARPGRHAPASRRCRSTSPSAAASSRLSDFFDQLEQLRDVQDEHVDVTGRLLRIGSIAITPDRRRPRASSQAQIGAATYLVPPTQGLTAGATAAGARRRDPGRDPGGDGTATTAHRDRDHWSPMSSSPTSGASSCSAASGRWPSSCSPRWWPSRSCWPRIPSRRRRAAGRGVETEADERRRASPIVALAADGRGRRAACSARAKNPFACPSSRRRRPTSQRQTAADSDRDTARRPARHRSAAASRAASGGPVDAPARAGRARRRRPTPAPKPNDRTRCTRSRCASAIRRASRRRRRSSACRRCPTADAARSDLPGRAKDGKTRDLPGRATASRPVGDGNCDPDARRLRDDRACRPATPSSSTSRTRPARHRQYQLDLVKIHNGKTASAAKATASSKRRPRAAGRAGPRCAAASTSTAGTLERRPAVVGDVARVHRLARQRATLTRRARPARLIGFRACRCASSPPGRATAPA